MNPNLLMSRLVRLSRVPSMKYQTQSRSYSRKPDEKESQEIPTNPLKNKYSANSQKENGKIYDKKPYKILLEKDKPYMWCLCGQSKNQPLCDGTHSNQFLKIKIKPIKFVVTETKEYWLCNCKQTLNRPFCDGTHKREDIQATRKY